MRILLLCHYPPTEGPSMRAYADLIASALHCRGHRVLTLRPPVLFGRLLPRPHPLSKWLGYLDCFLLFPPLLWLRARRLPQGSLYVLMDQALGPWLPWIADRPHLLHCHDFLALEASQGRQPFHHLTASGRAYQRWIRRGFRGARAFLSVSAATRAGLHAQLPAAPRFSELLPNPRLPRFQPLPPHRSAQALQQARLPQLADQPFLLHIGRNWYKNREGLLLIWEHLHGLGIAIPLVLIGALSAAQRGWLEQRPQLAAHLLELSSASDELVVALYNRAALLLFPSHAEGFGWPILEALACGCPVLTTERPPMTEVGGAAVAYILPMPPPPQAPDAWAAAAADQVAALLRLDPATREQRRQIGFAQAARFDLELWGQQLEGSYRQALALQQRATP